MEADTGTCDRIPVHWYLQNPLPIAKGCNHFTPKRRKNKSVFRVDSDFLFPQQHKIGLFTATPKLLCDTIIHDSSFKLKQENPQGHQDLEQQSAPLLLAEAPSPQLVCHDHDHLVLLLIHGQGEGDSQN